MRREFGGDSGVVQLATRIPKSLHIRVRVTALDQHMTLSDWVSTALAEHLERCEGGKKRPGPKATPAAG